MPRGGARPGAGRKPKAQKFAAPIARAEKQISDKLPGIVANLLRLADGGYDIVEETWEPAGTVMVSGMEIYEPQEGPPRSMKVSRQAFPDLPADQLVLIRRVVSTTDMDRAANIYLVDRILGKPKERHEVDATGSAVIVVRAIDYREQLMALAPGPDNPDHDPDQPALE
jgi:hypothetical protein